MSSKQLAILCVAIVLTGLTAGFGPGIYATAYPVGPGAATWEKCAEVEFRFNFKKMKQCVAYTDVVLRPRHGPSAHPCQSIGYSYQPACKKILAARAS